MWLCANEKQGKSGIYIRGESADPGKILFMRDLYQATLQDKKRYKKQILGSKDSFGKIFDITRKLDIVQPEELFIETMHIMEEVLENEPFAF